jgi:pimeloyl-ACP methyl ester carboxylesterase
MSSRKKLLGLAAGSLGTAAAVVAGVAVERRVVRTRRTGAQGIDEFTRLRSDPVEVTTSDGVRLHAEVDEVAPYATGTVAEDDVTLVFVHGYALSLDCWHFQRERFRGKHRMVFYDQRSHGRSARSTAANATIDQLGHDLKAVVDQLAPQGRVVLLGHSMGGMAIMAFAEHYPDLFGKKVIGAALVSTLPGGMRTSRVLTGRHGDRLLGQITPRLIAGLARAPELVDSARRRGSNIGYVVTDRFAFGDKVPPSYVEFVDQMLAQTPFEVLAEFFPNFDALDKFAVLHAFEHVPTVIICGDKDRVTSVGHSRKMAELMPWATLVECAGAGHLVILERKDEVNAALEEMIAEAESSGSTSRAS